MSIICNISSRYLDYRNWQLFMLSYYAIAMRIFIGNHDRYRTNHIKSLSRLFVIIRENLAVMVTLCDKAYNSIRKKTFMASNFHYSWPFIPYNQLYKFDAIVMQNKECRHILTWQNRLCKHF